MLAFRFSILNILILEYKTSDKLEIKISTHKDKVKEKSRSKRKSGEKEVKEE